MHFDLANGKICLTKTDCAGVIWTLDNPCTSNQGKWTDQSFLIVRCTFWHERVTSKVYMRTQIAVTFTNWVALNLLFDGLCLWKCARFQRIKGFAKMIRQDNSRKIHMFSGGRTLWSDLWSMIDERLTDHEGAIIRRSWEQGRGKWTSAIHDLGQCLHLINCPCGGRSGGWSLFLSLALCVSASFHQRDRYSNVLHLNSNWVWSKHRFYCYGRHQMHRRWLIWCLQSTGWFLLYRASQKKLLSEWWWSHCAKAQSPEAGTPCVWKLFWSFLNTTKQIKSA